MAHDIEFINEVRVWFETHDDEITEVAKRFSVPSTTVNTWKKQGKSNEGTEWVKGKYMGHLQAAKKIAKEQIASDLTAAIKKELEGEILANTPQPTDKDKENAADVAEALILDMLVLGNLNREMAWAVVKGKSFAENAKNIGTIKVYTEIIEKAKNQIFGKDPDVVNIFGVNFENMTPSDLKGKSTKELEALMAQKLKEADEKRKAIDAEVTQDGQ